MQFMNALTIAGVLTAGIGVSATQDPPPPPPTQATPPATQTQSIPPATQTPPLPVGAQTQTPPPTPPVQTQVPPPTAPVEAPTTAPAFELTGSALRHRLDAIYLFEGVLVKAVNLAAQQTAGEIRRIEPGLVMFSSSPVRVHGTYLEGYGVFFQVEIPSVIPSVASLVEQLQRGDRLRPSTTPAQPTALSGAASEPMLDPDAHYVQSVKDQLINVMVRQSNSLELKGEEWLTIAARDASETPGQVAQPSTMTLRIKGSDLIDVFAGRITIDDARSRVHVRGF